MYQTHSFCTSYQYVHVCTYFHNDLHRAELDLFFPLVPTTRLQSCLCSGVVGPVRMASGCCSKSTPDTRACVYLGRWLSGAVVYPGLAGGAWWRQNTDYLLPCLALHCGPDPALVSRRPRGSGCSHSRGETPESCCRARAEEGHQ